METLKGVLIGGALAVVGITGCTTLPLSLIDQGSGNAGSGDVVGSAQTLRHSDQSSEGHPECPHHHCGDGVVNHHEACDDGNLEDGDGCSAQCQLDDVWSTPGDERPGYVQCRQAAEPLTCGPDQGCCAQPNPGGPACAAEVSGCGQNPTFQSCDGPEDCEEDRHCVGTRFGNTCAMMGYYWVCHTDADCESSRPHCDDGGICTEPAACGDGNLGDDEECDDGNTEGGDGCSADCTHDDISSTPGDDRAGYVACGLSAPELTCGPDQGCCTLVRDSEGNPVGPSCAADRNECPLVPSFHACDGPEDCEEGVECMGTRFGNICGSGYYRVCHSDEDCESSRPSCGASGTCGS